MAKIVCPKCGGENYFSIKQPVYQGPFRCAKCRELFTILIEDDVLKSCQPMDKQEVDKLQARKQQLR